MWNTTTIPGSFPCPSLPHQGIHSPVFNAWDEFLHLKLLGSYPFLFYSIPQSIYSFCSLDALVLRPHSCCEFWHNKDSCRSLSVNINLILAGDVPSSRIAGWHCMCMLHFSAWHTWMLPPTVTESSGCCHLPHCLPMLASFSNSGWFMHPGI